MWCNGSTSGFYPVRPGFKSLYSHQTSVAQRQSSGLLIRSARFRNSPEVPNYAAVARLVKAGVLYALSHVGSNPTCRTKLTIHCETVYNVEMTSKRNRKRHNKIVKQMVEHERKRKEYNEEQKRKFEAKWHKRFCILPRRTTSKKWVWFDYVYVRYKAVKKDYVKVHGSGGWEVTDPISHYMYYEYAYGPPIEVLTGVEAFKKELKEPRG